MKTLSRSFFIFLPTYFISNTILATSEQEVNTPERSRYVKVEINQATRARELRTLSAVKVNNTYTKVEPHVNGIPDWGDGYDIVASEESPIVPLIDSFRQLHLREGVALTVKLQYNGRPRDMELTSIPELHYKQNGTSTVPNGCFYECDNCERLFYHHEECFSYIGYREPYGQINSYGICLNCISGEVKKKNWKLDKEQKVKEWMSYDTTLLAQLPHELLSITYDYTQPTPLIDLEENMFSVEWADEVYNLRSENQQLRDALPTSVTNPTQFHNNHQDTNVKSFALGIIIGNFLMKNYYTKK